ncbi:MAG: hypothetical protein ACK55Z_35685, partial [bacterium]
MSGEIFNSLDRLRLQMGDEYLRESVRALLSKDQLSIIYLSDEGCFFVFYPFILLINRYHPELFYSIV